MNILLVTEFFPSGKGLRFSGGVEARTFFIAKFLARKHSISIIASRGLKDPKTEKMYGFTVYRIGPKRDYSVSVGHLISRIIFIRDAIKFGRTFDVEIVDGGNYISHFIAKNIAVSKKIPCVAWYPDVWLNDWIKNAGMYGLFGEILERVNLLRGFNSYIAISNNTANKLKKFTQKNVHVVYCGVDENEFMVDRAKFKEPTIISVSRLTKYKNIKTVILAFASLSTKIKNVRLIIVGSGSEENRLKDLVKELKITKRVNFLKNLPRRKLIELYKMSHVFSLPSTVEGFGIATIEAGAAGLPYVNSDAFIHQEVTKNGFGGYLENSEIPSDFSKRFHELITNERLYNRKSKQAKKLSQIYSWKKISDQTEAIYESTVKKYEY